MNKKSYIIGGVVIAAIIIIAIAVGVRNNDKNNNEYSQSQTPTKETMKPAPSASTTPSTTPSTTTTTGGTPAALTYTQAMALYGKGYRIQFNECHGTPGALVIKSGDKFMFDNRDSSTHVVSYGGYSYTLKGYGFAIITAKATGKFNITCDKGGAATINIEK